MHRKIALAAATLAALTAAASAHLEPGSLSSPMAGQAYAVGSQVFITWVQAEFHHGKYSLAFSRNGGTTWESIASWTGPSGDNVTVKYAWTVPDATGSASRVRVCQLENCGDPDYVLVSGDFTVAPAAAVHPSARTAPPAMRFIARSGRLEVSFELVRSEAVIIEAFDVRGARVATLLDAVHGAGVHAYSLDSRLLRSGKPLVLGLRMGRRTAVRTLIPSP